MIFWATLVWCPLSGASCLGSFQTRSDWTSTVSAEPWLKSYVFFFGGSHPSSQFFLPEDGCFLYIFDLNFAKVLDFFLLICGTLLLHWTWEVTSLHFLGPWCPFSRHHQPKVPARAPCQAWCLEANGKFGAVWGLYVNCVWWKIDFCAKKSAALNLSISEIVFLFKGLRVKFVIFQLVFLLRWRHVQLFNLFWSHWHRSCSHHWKLFLQQLRWANPNLRTTTTSLPTTCPRNDENEKTNWQQKTTTKRRHQKKMNIWTSPSSGMDFFKVGLKTSMWLYRAEKKTNHRLPLWFEERAGISCKPPGTSGILSTRRVALF